LALLAAACARSGNAPLASAGLSTEAVVIFYEKRIQRDPADFTAYNSLASAYLQRGRETGDVADYLRAEAALTMSLEVLPGENEAAQAQLAVVFNTKHQFAEAAAAAKNVLATRPQSMTAYAALADALQALGRYDEAKAAVRALEEMEPGFLTLARQARLHELGGEIEQAEVAWLEAHRATAGSRSETTAWAHTQLGHLYLSQGNTADAKRQFQQALNEFPGYVHALAGMGKAHAAERQYGKAIRFYRQAVDRVPVPEYVIALGDVYAAAGDEANANRQYALVGAIDRLYRASGLNTDLQMALFAADHGQAPEAVQRAQAAYAARPDIFAADVLAWALYQDGAYEEAQRYSQEALRLGTRDALMLFHAGMIAHRLGQVHEAWTHLERALAINPGFSVLYRDIAKQNFEGLRSTLRAPLVGS
jgi:tetratricopeptide (TPR) repeat protein